jgi:hypothetical protein
MLQHVRVSFLSKVEQSSIVWRDLLYLSVHPRRDLGCFYLLAVVKWKAGCCSNSVFNLRERHTFSTVAAPLHTANNMCKVLRSPATPALVIVSV